MHKLLERQLRKQFGSLEAVPKELMPILQDVEAVYAASDQDRTLLERSLELTSQELMQRNHALRESEERYRRMIETATEGIMVSNEDDEVIFANERFAQMLGLSVSQMIGLTVFEFMRPEDRQAAAGRLDERRQGMRGHHEVRFRRADGSEVWTILSASPILDENGAYQGALAMVTDITDRKRAEDELRNSFERLQELDRFRTQFINNAAHELGTPLTPIKLQVHMLRNAFAQSLDPSLLKTTEILERNVERLSQLVTDILDVSKIQSGRLNLKFERADIVPIVREATESFHAAAVRHGVSLEVLSQGPLWTHVDARRFGQVLYNLINNALKFTPTGGKILVNARVVGPNVQVTVRDTGLGIKAEDLAKLFRPFSQVHDTMQVTAAGTGLGLYISRGIVEQMGGRIWAESAGIGRGTSFFVEIPLAKAASNPHLASSSPPTSVAMPAHT